MPSGLREAFFGAYRLVVEVAETDLSTGERWTANVIDPNGRPIILDRLIGPFHKASAEQAAELVARDHARRNGIATPDGSPEWRDGERLTAKKMQLRNYDEGSAGCPKCGHAQLFWNGLQPDGQWHGKCANPECGVLLRGVTEGDKLVTRFTSINRP